MVEVNSCELLWTALRKKNTCMVCVCDCCPTIDIYPSSLQSWTLSAAAHSPSSCNMCLWPMLFFLPFLFPCLSFSSLMLLLFWTWPLRQTLADTCLCFYCVWMLCLFWTHTLAYLWHILIHSNHNMTQDRAQEIAKCKHLLHKHFAAQANSVSHRTLLGCRCSLCMDFKFHVLYQCDSDYRWSWNNLK